MLLPGSLSAAAQSSVLDKDAFAKTVCASLAGGADLKTAFDTAYRSSLDSSIKFNESNVEHSARMIGNALARQVFDQCPDLARRAVRNINQKEN